MRKVLVDADDLEVGRVVEADHPVDRVGCAEKGSGQEGHGDGALGIDIPIQGLVLHDLGDAGVVLLVFIEGKLVVESERDGHRYGQAGGQTGDIQDRVQFVLREGPQCGFDKIPDHEDGLCTRSTAESGIGYIISGPPAPA